MTPCGFLHWNACPPCKAAAANRESIRSHATCQPQALIDKKALIARAFVHLLPSRSRFCSNRGEAAFCEPACRSDCATRGGRGGPAGLVFSSRPRCADRGDKFIG